jgi:hypothetical protein
VVLIMDLGASCRCEVVEREEGVFEWGEDCCVLISREHLDGKSSNLEILNSLLFVSLNTGLIEGI